MHSAVCSITRDVLNHNAFYLRCAPARLNANIQQLRRKLGIYGDQYIETVPRVGYRFRPAALRLENLLHRIGTDCAGSRRSCRLGRSTRGHIS
jgi:hypothetical protein